MPFYALNPTPSLNSTFLLLANNFMDPGNLKWVTRSSVHFLNHALLGRPSKFQTLVLPEGDTSLPDHPI